MPVIDMAVPVIDCGNHSYLFECSGPSISIYDYNEKKLAFFQAKAIFEQKHPELKFFYWQSFPYGNNNGADVTSYFVQYQLDKSVELQFGVN